MEFSITSKKHNSVVGDGLSTGELRQWILDSYQNVDLGSEEEKTAFLSDFEELLYDSPDENLLGEWFTPNDLLVVTGN